ncbi:DNA polymerase gamma, catalytic subunit tam isoform X2 [Rhodnius prolixus]
MIPESLYCQLFKTRPKVIDPVKIKECLKELMNNNLCKQQEAVSEIDITLPKLAGNNVEEHFWNIGNEQAGPYKELVLEFIKQGIPKAPKEWLLQKGWTKYDVDGTVTRIDYPSEDALVFDVEVCLNEGPCPTLACAVSPKAWYGWVSDELASDIHLLQSYTSDRLIPLESVSLSEGNNRIVIGHNVSFDRARVKEQYRLKRTPLRFLDTMSLHICVSGVTSGQKALLKAGSEQEEWTKFASLNSLPNVYELYCDSKLLKTERDLFINGTLQDIRTEFQTSMNYCSKDVIATYEILQKLFLLFLERFPHPVTLAGMLELQTAYIPVNMNWKRYISDSKEAYEDLEIEAHSLLTQSANDACKLYHNRRFKEDLWLWDQDWSTKQLKLKKTAPSSSKSKLRAAREITEAEGDEDLVDDRLSVLKENFSSLNNKRFYLPAKPPRLPGYPFWYRKLAKQINEISIPEPEIVSTALKIIPKLLRLTWKLLPLHYEQGNGWGYLVPTATNIPLEKNELVPFTALKKHLTKHSIKLKNVYTVYNKKKKALEDEVSSCGLVKLPHKDGSHLNVGNPLAKDFINRFSENELSGSGSYAKRIIEISRMLSYWRNNRERIEKQLVCWLRKDDLPKELETSDSIGVILPQLVVCGTLTRRAVEPTWLTVSNAIVERIGSELRGIVHAPPGYVLVGADVDSQELWIAALLSDSTIGMHGATPFGWMTLNGRKNEGTDTHTVTAKAVGISRSNAKVLNYARIYGAGQKFAERLLKQFNAEMSQQDAADKAKKMMSLTKGTRMYKLKSNVLLHLEERSYTKEDALEISRIHCRELAELFDKSFWKGGIESAMFNCIESIANEITPETPFLKSRLSRALEPKLDAGDKYLPTRINWVVQSGAVDFLHLMLVSMRWFLGDEPRFCLSFHDEVRYMVEEKRKYETALCLHLTNLLTRSFCVSRVGMTDLPQSVAFFTSVEVDKVLRKESDDDNKTPSNPFGLLKGYGVPIGESLDVCQAMKKSKGMVRTHLTKSKT